MIDEHGEVFRVPLLAYADDVVNTEESSEDLKVALYTLLEKLDEDRLSPNNGKTKIMITDDGLDQSRDTTDGYLQRLKSLHIDLDGATATCLLYCGDGTIAGVACMGGDEKLRCPYVDCPYSATPTGHTNPGALGTPSGE